MKKKSRKVDENKVTNFVRVIKKEFVIYNFYISFQL